MQSHVESSVQFTLNTEVKLVFNEWIKSFVELNVWKKYALNENKKQCGKMKFSKIRFRWRTLFSFFPNPVIRISFVEKNIFSVKFCYAVSMWNFVISYSLFNTMNKCFGGSLNIIMNCCVCSENFKEVTLLIFLLNNLSLNKCRAYLN